MPRPSKPWFWKQKQCWYVTINGRRIRLFEDRDESFKKFHAIMADQVILREECLVVVMDELLDWTQKNRRPGTYRFYREHTQQLTTWLKERNIVDLECDELTPSLFEEYLEQCSHGRRHGAVQVIKRVYNWGTRRGRIKSNPMLAVEKPSAGRRRNYVTETTYKLLLKHSDDFLGSLIEFCWETGCRPQEAWRLRPDHIQTRLQRCVIPKGLTKRNRGDRHIYCTDRALEILNERPDGFDFVFTNSKGTQWNKDNIGKRMDNLKKHVGKRYALYDIRHTWITNKVKKGVPIHMVAKLAGTSIAMIERFYDESDQDAKFMLDVLKDSA